MNKIGMVYLVLLSFDTKVELENIIIESTLNITVILRFALWTTKIGPIKKKLKV